MLSQNEILSHFKNVKGGVNDQYTAICPAHNDKNASLSIKFTDEKTLFHCFAGCSFEQIRDSAGFSNADLFINNQNRTSSSFSKPFKEWVFLRAHEYKTANGETVARKLIYRIDTFGKKSAKWEYFFSGHWLQKKDITDEERVSALDKIPLYHLPEILKSSADTLYIVEGEKDVETLENAGLTATTTAHGSGTAPKASAVLPVISKFSKIVVICDNDEPGKKYGVKWLKILPNAFIIHSETLYAGLQEHGDITDVISLIGPQECLKRVENAVLNYVPTVPIFQNEKKLPKKQKLNVFDLLPMAEKLHLTYRNEQMYIYEQGIYRPFNAKEIIAGKLKHDEAVSKITIGDLDITLELRARANETQIFDTLICTDDGIYNFLTQKITPYDKKCFFTQKFPSIGNPEPVFDYLNSFCDNPEKIGFFLGSCFFSHNKWEKCLFLVGEPSTGKSTLLEIFSRILFPENSSSYPIFRKYVRNFDYVALIDKWINVCDDIFVDNDSCLNLQSLVSGKVPVTIERKYGQPFQTFLRAKYAFSTNHTPIFSKECEGMKRRSLFVNTFKSENIPKIPNPSDFLAYALHFAKILHEKKFSQQIFAAEEVIINNPIIDYITTVKFPCSSAEFYPKFIIFCKNNAINVEKEKLTKNRFFEECKKVGLRRTEKKSDGQVIGFWSF